jgi:hypothetical protein
MNLCLRLQADSVSRRFFKDFAASQKRPTAGRSECDIFQQPRKTCRYFLLLEDRRIPILRAGVAALAESRARLAGPDCLAYA